MPAAAEILSRYGTDAPAVPGRQAPSLDLIRPAGAAPPVVVGELWTAAQRQACSLHEISYRACYKPQLPGYFISRFTEPGDLVYDPFSGRGTTAVEAALRGRRVVANDVNPLSAMLARPRLDPPCPVAVRGRLAEIEYRSGRSSGADLGMFFHPDTESELVCLQEHFARRHAAGKFDAIDDWIRMVALNRLTGHSPGFFSVYSLPPNQATTRAGQRRINERRGQTPEYRDTKTLILAKTKSLLKSVDMPARAALRAAAASAEFLTEDARHTAWIQDASVALVVTSPPFLDVIQYATDNAVRSWFAGVDVEQVAPRITMACSVEGWSTVMREVLCELARVVRPGGRIAFEVGDVRKGTVKLDEVVAPLGMEVGLECEVVLINRQGFTKTANIWGVGNNVAGTNENKIVVFRR